MALILLVSALLLGATIVSWLRLPLYPFEAAALAVVLGLFTWTWVAFLGALVLPYGVAILIAIGVSVAAGISLWATRRLDRPVWRPLEGGRAGWLLWGAATLITTVVLSVLFWTHNLVQDSTGVYSAGSTWADFGLHASFVSHFAQFGRMPMDLPLASGTSMTYPFLVDLLSSFYLRNGWDLHLSLFVPGLLLMLAICQLVIAFSLRLFGHIGAAVGGLALLLLLGTAGGLPTAVTEWQQSGLSVADFLADLPRDYTVLSPENGNVTNVVAHALLPGRSILFGMGVGLAVLILLHAARENRAAAESRDAAGESGAAGDGRRYLLTAGVLIGLLPLAHPHSFLVSGAVLAALAVDAAVRFRRPPWDHLVAGGIAVVVAAPQLIWQQVANGDGTGGRVRLGWLVQTGESIWAFWWFNFGLMGVLIIALPFVLLRPVWRQYLVWYLPFLGIFVVTQVYAFQPFEYDNVKLIYWVYLMAGLFAALLAVEAYRARKWAVALVLPVAVAVTIPGMLSFTHEFQLRDQFASNADIALAGWVRSNTAPDDVFIGTDRPNQPVATLAGRPLVMGYRGWLYAWNLPYAERELAVNAALQGRVDDPDLLSFDPEYLVVAMNEDTSFPLDRDALTALPVAYQNDEWMVFQLP